MVYKLLIICLIQLMAYEAIGRSIKRFLKIDFKEMNFIIGYLFSVLIFYLINVYFVLNHYSYHFLNSTLFPIYLIIMVIFILFSIRTRIAHFDYIVVLLSLVYIMYFFMYAFIIPGESTYYLSQIHNNLHIEAINLSVFQTYTLLYSQIFQINSTIYTVNVMTFINLFIILYTIYECFRLFFHSVNNSRIGFIGYLFLFTIVNTQAIRIFLPNNAFDFIYHPYLGRTVYLYALIPMQFALFYKLERKLLGVFFLINLTSMAFTSLSLYMQFFLNIAFIITLLILKAYPSLKELSTFTILTIFPLFIHFLFFSYQPSIRILYAIVFCLLLGFINLMHYERKYNQERFIPLSLILLITSLFIIYSYIYHNIKMPMSDEIMNTFNNNQQLAPLFVFYLLSLFALYKLYNTKAKINTTLFYLPIFVFIIIINPLSLYFMYQYNIQYAYFFFLLPLSFSIVYVVIKRTTYFEKAIMAVLILSLWSTIFKPLTFIKNTNQNTYYRIDQKTLQISDYLNQQNQHMNILTSENLVDEITVNTQNVTLLFDYLDVQNIENYTKDENLLFMYYSINDKVPFDITFISNTILTYHINAIIVDSKKLINSQLSTLCQTEKEINNYIIYTF